MRPSPSSAFADAPVPVAVVGLRQGALGDVLLANSAFAALVGASAAALVGRPLVDLLHPDDAPLLQIGSTEQVQVRVLRPDAGPVWVVASQSAGRDTAIIALQDVTLWRRIGEELSHRASHDALTGLANRSQLVDHIDGALARLARRSGTVAVLFSDLDGFKELNDTFGHRIGDAVLQEVATRIRLAVRDDDLVVRIGGDEFVVVCEAADSAEAGQVAERVRASLEAPVRVLQRDFSLSVSIGIAQVGENTARAEDLVRRADLAMYRAKQRGRNRVEFFAPEMEEQARRRVETVERIRTALLTGNIAIEVQSVIDLATGAWVGSEALARIRQHDGTPLLPGQFLETASRAGLLERLDGKVRKQAMAWLAGRGTGSPQWVSVNVVARELAAMRYAATVEQELHAYGLQSQQLMLEVSDIEMADLQGPVQVTLQRLRSMGCRVAIDDFGSGRSSLRSLRDLPADMVKIDKAFVAGLGHDDHDEAIVAAIVSVAHGMGRTVVAEGVEHPVQAEILRSLGCDLGQGYLYGTPDPPAGAEPEATGA